MQLPAASSACSHPLTTAPSDPCPRVLVRLLQLLRNVDLPDGKKRSLGLICFCDVAAQLLGPFYQFPAGAATAAAATAATSSALKAAAAGMMTTSKHAVHITPNLHSLLLQVLPVVCVIGCVSIYWLAEWTLRRVDPTGGCLCHGLPSVSIADLLASLSPPLPPPLPPLLLHVACPPCVRVIARLCVLPCCPVIRVRRLHSQQAC